MIEVKNLSKQYGSQMAVSDLTFTITPGKIYGFLGPNGAGKTTTMNMITGCLAATSGEVKIGGYDIFERPKEAKSLVGYLPELPPLYMDQTVREYLYFVARAKGMKKQDVEPELEKVIEETRIGDVSEKLIRHLSKGYRQRVGIAQALLGNPEIIILDEPTVGLDPAQIIEIRELIKVLGEQHTVILSSHILSEIQAICDEVLIIHKGRLVAFDKLENLSRTLSSGNTVEICCEAPADKLKGLLARIEGIVSVEIKEEEEGLSSAMLSVGEENPTMICREIFLLFAEAGVVLQKLNPVKATLEDIFMRITSDQNNEDAFPAAGEGLQGKSPETDEFEAAPEKTDADEAEQDRSEESDSDETEKDDSEEHGLNPSENKDTMRDEKESEEAGTE